MSSTPIPTPVTLSQFRIDYPEFASALTYPDSSVTYWLNLGGLMLDPAHWGTLLGLGIELFAAHNIQVEAMNQQATNAGGFPGINKGPVSSEGADGVSVSYDVGAAIQKDAGHWNLTNYGTRFARLANQAGMGPLQIGSFGGDSAVGLNFGPFGFPDTF